MRHGARIAAALGLLLAACDRGVSPPSGARVLLDLPAERNAVVRAGLVVGADTLRGAVVLVPLPGVASAAVVRGDSVAFATDTVVRVRVTAGGVAAESTLRVLPPPTVVFEVAPAGALPDIMAVSLDGGELRPVAAATAADQQPTAAGSRVVFVSRRSGTFELWSTSVPDRGSTVPVAAVPLTNTAAVDEEQPALSPDGQRLAWLVPVGGNTQVWAGDQSAGGGGRFVPADGVTAPLEKAPAWRTATELAWAAVRGGGTLSLWRGTVGGAPGSATSLVPATTDSVRFDPAFSPDASQMVFTTDRLGGSGTSLVWADGAGQNRRLLLGGTFQVLRPQWLDARRVVASVVLGGQRQLAWFDARRPDRLVAVPGTVGGRWVAVAR